MTKLIKSILLETINRKLNDIRSRNSEVENFRRDMFHELIEVDPVFISKYINNKHKRCEKRFANALFGEG